MRLSFRRASATLLVLAPLVALQCRAPTQLTLIVRTDVPCTAL